MCAKDKISRASGTLYCRIAGFRLAALAKEKKVSTLRRTALLFFRTVYCSSKPAQDTLRHTFPERARPPSCQSYRPNLRLRPRTERQRVLSRQRGYCDASVGVYYSQKQCRCPVGPFRDFASERAIHCAREVLTAYDGTGKASGACLHLQSIVLARFAAGKSASLSPRISAIL